MQYDEALARNKAASKPGISGWLPDTRGAPPGYTPISPMMSRPQLLNPEVAAVGNYWVGQGADMDGDKHRPNGVKTGVCSFASLGLFEATLSASWTGVWKEPAAPSIAEEQTASSACMSLEDRGFLLHLLQPSRHVALHVKCCNA